ncbi:MAG: LVIVD repeat-containing protein [Deltaproteobacteria bacterium]
MKNKFYALMAIITTSMVLLSGCMFDDCKETVKYKVYNPVYLTKSQLRNIDIREPAAMKNPGKIYVYGKYLFVNELYEGVHVFDNSNPSNPVNLSFISIPGNVDIAVKSNILYADNYIDLLSFDITIPASPKLVKKLENVFSKYKYENPGLGYLVYYRATDRIEEVNCSDINGDIMFESDGTVLVDFSGTKDGGNSGGAGSVSGLGGSMARFTIMKERLYIVDNSSLQVVNVEKADDPFLTNKVEIGWGIETIYPFKENLFIGSNTGMFIFSATNPDKPELLSNFVHAVACDPVFAVGDIAYVTLRTGNNCRGIKDQLDVINIKNLLNPTLVKTYEMSNPHGLSVLDDKMVLCEGEFGLKVLDVKDPKDIEIKSKIQNKHFYDVIILSQNDIILVGNDGLYQYKMDGYELKELSVIKVEN